MTMQDDIKIRLAEAADSEELFSIWIDAISQIFTVTTDQRTQFKKDFLSNFDRRSGVFNFWVAEDSTGKIVGFQSLLPNTSNPLVRNLTAESSTYLHSDARGLGIGGRLLNYVMGEAEKSELLYVFGLVSERNGAVRNIASKSGWMEVGELPASKKASFPARIFMVRPV